MEVHKNEKILLLLFDVNCVTAVPKRYHCVIFDVIIASVRQNSGGNVEFQSLQNEFVNRHIGISPTQKEDMLALLGYKVCVIQ